MKKERKTIGAALLRVNEGQVDWLPKNPREWREGDMEKMRKSIREDPDFLEDRPALVVPHGKGYVIFCGNFRTEGARAEGIEEIPCVVYRPETDADRLTVIRRAMKDNGSYGRFDWDILADEWDEFPLEDWGVKTFGPEEGEETKDAGGGAVAGASEDDFDEESDGILVRCRPGDIWELGEHRLMCGDSKDLSQIERLMGGEKADMIFTDPPYGVSYTDKNEFLNRIDASQRLTNPIENDHLSPEEMNSFWQTVFGNLAAVTKDDAAYYVTSPQGDLLLAIRDTPFALKHMLIWNKNNHVLGRGDYNYKHEPIIYGWKKKGTHHFYGNGEFKTTVWDIPKPMKNDLHPTMKPIALVANCLLDCTKEGDSVIDVFGGSGTTLIAAEQLGRKCYMMELDPHYCDVIIARWEKLTGRDARKMN